MLMKQGVNRILLLSFLAVFLTAGCGAENTVYLEQIESGTEDFTEDRIAYAVETAAEDTKQKSGKESVDVGDVQDSEAIQEDDLCYVYVCGEVRAPGVYALEQGSRIYEAIAMAGGLTKEASAASVNQAELVEDGQMVYIPTEEETAGMLLQPGTEADVSDGRIDLNTASLSELMTLSGIGETKAESILAYREKNGGFSAVEEIMQVEGIKEGLYNRIKDDIKVK